MELAEPRGGYWAMARMATRREFFTLTTAGAAIALAPGCAHAAPVAVTNPTGGHPAHRAGATIPRRPFGRTGVQVSVIGVGGWHLGAAPDEQEAVRIVHEAIDAGVNFFDNAWEYHDGRSEEILGRALVGKRADVFVMTKVCTHGRGAQVAMNQLEDSLRRLKTDHLDLWQIHECIYDNDPALHFAAGGVVEALERAKTQGKVRFVGFTGHKDPGIHLDMLARGFHFDSAQMPLNCFDASFRSFEENVVPVAIQRGMAVIGMKSMGGGGESVRAGAVSAEEALRYAMSIPGVTVTVSGIDSLDVLSQNLAVARGFAPMSPAGRAALRSRVLPYAGDGHFELYKTTKHYDAKVGRAEHGYPAPGDLPL
jgi:aryl-alcohol dehydrogenase-like predicted oxidoreductase